MPLYLSRSEIRALSKRLREGEAPSPQDLTMLGEHLLDCNASLREVSSRLASIGISATTRLKTSGTIIEKLKRQPELDLLNIRDLAGARIVQRMTLDEQDEVAATIAGLWPDTRVIDRRAVPSSGYRAVHLVPRVLGHPVEIQLRTLWQDTWAQVMETFGDIWGREIRYGGEPLNPDTPSFAGSEQSRRDRVRHWIDLSTELHRVAEMENELARVSPSDDPEISQLRQQIDSLRVEIRGLAQFLAEQAR